MALSVFCMPQLKEGQGFQKYLFSCIAQLFCQRPAVAAEVRRAFAHSVLNKMLSTLQKARSQRKRELQNLGLKGQHGYTLQGQLSHFPCLSVNPKTEPQGEDCYCFFSFSNVIRKKYEKKKSYLHLLQVRKMNITPSAVKRKLT